MSWLSGIVGGLTGGMIGDKQPGQKAADAAGGANALYSQMAKEYGANYDKLFQQALGAGNGVGGNPYANAPGANGYGPGQRAGAGDWGGTGAGQAAGSWNPNALAPHAPVSSYGDIHLHPGGGTGGGPPMGTPNPGGNLGNLSIAPDRVYNEHGFGQPGMMPGMPDTPMLQSMSGASTGSALPVPTTGPGSTTGVPAPAPTGGTTPPAGGTAAPAPAGTTPPAWSPTSGRPLPGAGTGVYVSPEDAAAGRLPTQLTNKGSSPTGYMANGTPRPTGPTTPPPGTPPAPAPPGSPAQPSNPASFSNPYGNVPGSTGNPFGNIPGSTGNPYADVPGAVGDPYAHSGTSIIDKYADEVAPQYQAATNSAQNDLVGRGFSGGSSMAPSLAAHMRMTQAQDVANYGRNLGIQGEQLQYDRGKTNDDEQWKRGVMADQTGYDRGTQADDTAYNRSVQGSDAGWGRLTGLMNSLSGQGSTAGQGLTNTAAAYNNAQANSTAKWAQMAQMAAMFA